MPVDMISRNALKHISIGANQAPAERDSAAQNEDSFQQMAGKATHARSTQKMSFVLAAKRTSLKTYQPKKWGDAWQQL